jgi:hypothetical protein
MRTVGLIIKNQPKKEDKDKEKKNQPKKDDNDGEVQK